MLFIIKLGHITTKLSANIPLPCRIGRCLSFSNIVINYQNYHEFIRPTVSSRSNIVTSHAEGPGSIPGRVNYLVEICSEVFPQL